MSARSTARGPSTAALSAPAGSVGQRIAVARARAGLSVRGLAARAGLPVSVLEVVERGDAPAWPAFTAAVARALSVDVGALHGQPYGPAITDPGAPHAAIPALRTALHGDDATEVAEPLPSPDVLRARMEDCDRHRGAARYGELARALPPLLTHCAALAATASSTVDTGTAEGLLAEACLLAQSAAYRLGYPDLAALANQQARTAAARSGDPLRAAVASAGRALLRLRRGDYLGVLLVLERAHTGIADQAGPAADAVRVQLHLREALTHARLGCPEPAEVHLQAARDLVGRGVAAGPYATVSATPAIVDMYWVAVAVELADPAGALERAAQVKIPTGEEPARVGRYWIDVAFAHAQRGEHAPAFDVLLQARAQAPELVRYHPQAREILLYLVESQRRTPGTLPELARWLSTAH